MMKRFLLLSLVALIGSGLAVKVDTNPPAAIAESTGPTTYLVLIVVDGGRPDYLNAPKTPNLHALMKNGTQYTNAIAGLLESETPSGHAAIATGSLPKYNGIPGFWWANSDNMTVNLFSPAKILAGDMEKVIKSSGATTIAGLVHRKNMNARVVALSGNKYYAADAIGGPNADTIMYFASDGKHLSPRFIPGHPPPSGVLQSRGLSIPAKGYALGAIDHVAMNLAIDTFQRERQQVTLINLPEFDWPLGHVYGANKDPRDVNTLMQGFDRDLGAMETAYAKAGVLSRTIFVVTADHGFTPLVHRVPQSEITNAVTKAGTSVLSQTSTTGEYVWLRNEPKATAVGANIAKLGDPFIQSVYARVHTRTGFLYQRVSSSKSLLTASEGAANQYLLQSFAGQNAPDVVVLFPEGVGVEPKGQASWKADHGGASWQAQHIPLVISGPGVRKGVVSSSPARLMDLAPTTLTLMGVPVIGMKGIPLADAFARSPASATPTQQAINRQLLPLVKAMQQESSLETRAGK
jgi:predicted AlkP superfamily pyrophosphatase or phosphodiesterase